jgi:RNA polymerase sigma factor (sigma-70 family)
MTSLFLSATFSGSNGTYMTDADHDPPVSSALITAAQAGDSNAFAQILAQHYDSIFRFAYRWCGHRSNAEDITQLACIKLAQSINQFRFEAAFSSWLYRLVINCAKDWYKSQQRHKHQSIDESMHCNEQESESLSLEHTTEHIAENKIYLRQLLQLLDSFADGFKETALLVYSEGLTHAEAAEVLHLKESTVSWRLHEIRKQLKQLQQHGDGSWEVAL